MSWAHNQAGDPYRMHLVKATSESEDTMSKDSDYRTFDASGRETTPIDVRVRLHQQDKERAATNGRTLAGAP